MSESYPPPSLPPPPSSPDSIGDLDAFTRLSRDFHLAVAEASHNRVLVVQLISLEHVSWPRRNVTATLKLARHILEIHTKLTDLIELRLQEEVSILEPTIFGLGLLLTLGTAASLVASLVVLPVILQMIRPRPRASTPTPVVVVPAAVGVR